ncbi:MAG: aminotransferase class I/II-fold pyridoxal phosphate-dependent enzyme [Woeseiaceae bacterium]|nr:aminotransferase class I/II-fold pyridoxal phosphate-dependent enzyme [Woeseiaceae bacterium]
MTENRELQTLQKALATLAEGFAGLPDYRRDYDWDALRDVLQQAATRMQDNYPYDHPLYAGQMLKPPHPVARMAYAMSMWINPNNHALDGGRASSAMELECIAALGDMFGLDRPLGHLCGGGTMANLEALWVSGRLHPGKTGVASAQSHYTHSRISEVLGLEFDDVAVTLDGRMDLAALEQRLEAGDVGTVVATLGTTGMGAVDPLPGILALQKAYGFRVHVDAAYGGYFHIAGELGSEARQAFDCIAEVDSIVVDPHKHGLQPYGCGCVLFRDPKVGMLYKHDSPYTYFSSKELHLGEITLECSRAGASAVALWATQKLLPMTPGGEFAQSLDRCLLAARALHERLAQSAKYHPLMPPQLDIVVYAVHGDDAQTASENASKVFDAAAEKNLHLALVNIPSAIVAHYWPQLDINRDTVACLRSCLLKPDHLDWVGQISAILEEVAP